MTWREHNLSGFICWCTPLVEMICPSCMDEDEEKAGCYRCGGAGWLPCDDPEGYAGDIGLLIIHNDPENVATTLPVDADEGGRILRDG